MNTNLRSLLIFFVVICSLPALAQDSTRQVAPADTLAGLGPDSTYLLKNGKVIPIETYAARYDPRRAILLAAVFPGAGQIYNKKYWKLPLVYGGFAGIGYAIWWNQDRYLFYRKGLFSLLNEPTTPVVVREENGMSYTQNGNIVINGKAYYPLPNGNYVGLDLARTAVNRYRRDRDFSVIMSFLFYAMQMIDAHVDAHLKEFDLNPQLKVSIEPSLNQNAYIGRSAGFGITLKF